MARTQKSKEPNDYSYTPLPHPERVSQEVIDAFNATFEKKFGWIILDPQGRRLKFIKKGPDPKETGDKHLDDINALNNLIEVIDEEEPQ